MYYWSSQVWFTKTENNLIMILLFLEKWNTISEWDQEFVTVKDVKKFVVRQERKEVDLLLLINGRFNDNWKWKNGSELTCWWDGWCQVTSQIFCCVPYSQIQFTIQKSLWLTVANDISSITRGKNWLEFLSLLLMTQHWDLLHRSRNTFGTVHSKRYIQNGTFDVWVLAGPRSSNLYVAFLTFSNTLLRNCHL